MKKTLIGLFVIFGLVLSPLSAFAQNEDTTEVILEDETPEAARRKDNFNQLVLNFSLFSCFVVAISAVVINRNNQKVFALKFSEENSDGSFTVKIHANNFKKLNDSPEEMHVVIRRGNCIFLKKPDLSNHLVKGEELFIVVVNQKTRIDFMHKDEVFVLDGEKLKKLSSK